MAEKLGGGKLAQTLDFPRTYRTIQLREGSSRQPLRGAGPPRCEDQSALDYLASAIGHPRLRAAICAGTALRLLLAPGTVHAQGTTQATSAFLFCGVTAPVADAALARVVAASVQSVVGSRGAFETLEAWETEVMPQSLEAATNACVNSAWGRGVNRALLAGISPLGDSYVVEVRLFTPAATGGVIVEVLQGTAEDIVANARAATTVVLDRGVPAPAPATPPAYPAQATLPVQPPPPGGPPMPAAPGWAPQPQPAPPGTPAWPQAPVVPPVPQEPESSPWILQLNVGYGAMFSGVGGSVELGYAGKNVGFAGFFGLGYFAAVQGGGPGAFGYGGGARGLAGSNPHFGYIAFAYSLAKTFSAILTTSDGQRYTFSKEDWGPSLLFGYEYVGSRFRAFADLGVSWVDGPYVEMDTLYGAVFTLDVGIGVDLIN